MITRDTNGHGARVKLRWMELDVEGGTPDLVEGFRSFANALSQSGRVVAPARTLAAANLMSDASTAVLGTPTTDEQNAEQPPEEEVAAAATIDTGGDGAQKTRKKYAPKRPTFLSNLNLDSAQVPLEEFAKAKNPTEVNDKYLVVATWFKEQMEMDEISSDHILTTFRALNWQVPDDPGSTFPNLKHKKQYFDKGKGVGGYKVTFLATNYVSKMGATQ